MDQRPQNFMCVTWTRFSPWQSLIDLVGEVGQKGHLFQWVLWAWCDIDLPNQWDAHHIAHRPSFPFSLPPSSFLPSLPLSLLSFISSSIPSLLLWIFASLFFSFIFIVKVKVESLSRVRLCDPMDSSLQQALCPWDFLGESTGVGCHFLLQGIFPTQASNPGLPHCRQMLYCLSHQGSPIFIVFDCKHGTFEYAVA